MVNRISSIITQTEYKAKIQEQSEFCKSCGYIKAKGFSSIHCSFCDEITLEEKMIVMAGSVLKYGRAMKKKYYKLYYKWAMNILEIGDVVRKDIINVKILENFKPKNQVEANAVHLVKLGVKHKYPFEIANIISNLMENGASVLELEKALVDLEGEMTQL